CGAGLVAILDYDGTLTPIVPSPQAAVLAPSVRTTLERLATSDRARLAILSGRALADVRARVALDDVIYGGCHGLEIRGGGREVFDFVPRVRWSKGEAARWIVHRAGRTLPRGSRVVLYAGDDATDEAAFAALKGRALTVRVGNGPSAANYRVRDVREMQAVLRRLAVALG